MPKLTINNLGPVSACEIEIKDFMVFTGPQASGKSTIAKSIFFFNNLNNILFSMYQKEMAAKSLFRNSGLETAFSKEVQRAFLQSFGIGTDSKAYGSVCYDYDNGSRDYGDNGDKDRSANHDYGNGGRENYRRSNDNGVNDNKGVLGGINDPRVNDNKTDDNKTQNCSNDSAC